MSKSNIVLEDGIDVNQLVTTGSVLHINTNYDDAEVLFEPEKCPAKTVDFIGHPVKSFAEQETFMVSIDDSGWVKKKVIEEGGGMPLTKGCTVSIAFSGYWENEMEPFDAKKPDRPLVIWPYT